ncbi:mitochondrial import inner membrane translocase subunit [Raphidocelis subcapitata]|uniref:Mitochondrial import inner membrane translocase subunit n=1 Tax=Raphidocelis subcapitata TaxID=307507 RepID=A0A2V0P6E9_9CHLO|nr:mitochondrial import inner membrane translocase subunit [Raphidocelis subcapitata]|eukprot:GBF92665.1 mitochondrial import inner membrane translocase subunit [Raphidocelis subcapitata]
MPPSNRRPLYSDSDMAPAQPEGAAPAAGSGGGGGGSGASPPGVGTVGAVGGGAALSPPGGGADAALDDGVPRLFTKQPCTVKGLAAALSAGVLGYLFGFVPGMIRHRASKWALVHLDGCRSAQSLAIMSGAYTAVHCICQRVRQVEDGWNRGLAGCATGLVLGWGNGPLGALQSCAGIGGLSYLIDFGGGAAEASTLPDGRPGRRGVGGAGGGASDGGAGGGARREVERRVREAMALPPVAFLGECFRVAYFDGCGGCSGGGGGGCSPWPLPAAAMRAPQQAAVAAASGSGSSGTGKQRRRRQRGESSP